MARCWFPSAYIHLLFVELAALFVMTASLYQTIKEHGSHNFYRSVREVRKPSMLPLQNVSDFAIVECGRQAMERMVWTGMLIFECGSASDGTYMKHTVFLSPLHGDLRAFTNARAICLLDWWTFFMSAGTAGYCIYRLWRTRESSFCSAGYLAFTWNLEQSRCYTLLVVLAASGPFVGCCWVIVAVAFGKGEVQGGLQAVNTIFGFVLVAYPAKLLLIPTTPIHHWTMERPSGIHFHREWWCLFTESNDVFGVRLVDALWRAKHGHSEKLEKMMQDPGETQAFMIAAGAMQHEEDGEADPLVLSFIKGIAAAEPSAESSSEDT